MKAIYKLHFDCGRGGMLHGLFITEKHKLKKLVATKEEIYFGEVNGKHSEVCGPLELNDFTFISDKPEDIEVVERLDLLNGYNPVEIYEDYCGEQEKESIFNE